MRNATEPFPFANFTPNQLTFAERDAGYERLHALPTTTHEQDGMQFVWKYEDVQEVMRAETPGLSNANSLDPLVGYARIMATPGAIPPFFRHLVPLPAKATANLTDQALHKRVWNVMAGATGHFTVPRENREQRADAMRKHFEAAMRNAGYAQNNTRLDVAAASVVYATRVTAEATGITKEYWPQVGVWSGAQSGLLGQRMRGRELAVAVEALGQLFTVSDKTLREPAAPDALAAHIREADLPHRVGVALMANSLAAGVHTVSGTIQQGLERVLNDHNREWWDLLAEPTNTPLVAGKVLQLDPGLVAWKRRAEQPVTLASGTKLKRGKILAMFAAANRDPAAFENPHDIQSRGKIPLTFGSGEHVCPGKQLATLAVEVFLRELHALAPNARLLRQIEPTARDRKHDLLFSGADVAITT